MNPAFQAIAAWPYNAVQRLHFYNIRGRVIVLSDSLPPRTGYARISRLDLGHRNWVVYSTLYGAYPA